MLLGIRPIVDFAFKKIFGTPENRIALISLLNAILNLKLPIADVTLRNPYNLQDFKDDKLSILDVKAVDQAGAIYCIEMQLRSFESLIQRIVFYGCELYADQLMEADKYSQIQPVYSICLVNGVIWKDAVEVHHVFRLTDEKTKRVLDGTLEIHTLELGRYNLTEADLAHASMLECWLFWLLHAHEYDLETLLKLFPQKAIQLATQAVARISQITEDKTMYDSREKAIRDRNWELNAARHEGEMKGKLEGELKGKLEGKIEGKVEMIKTLRGLLQMPVGDEQELRTMDLAELDSLTNSLQGMLRNRMRE
jgi:predicted transposase/invertase (TIGR01784 family)